MPSAAKLQRGPPAAGVEDDRLQGAAHGLFAARRGAEARAAEAAREAMHLHLRAALQLAKKSGLVKESDVSESEKGPPRKKRA